jgi:3-oxoacyl-[acyl-carrier-protein] synthase-1
MSAPDPTGAGAALAIRAALTRAGLEPLDIDYINLHGSATVANDLAEDAAVFEIFGGCAPCSSTKGFSGHVLGAAGIIEALFSCLAVESDVAFRTMNTVNVDHAIRSPILLETHRTPITNVMSNSFGFGGGNMSLILGRPS